jgi:twinkle protein
MLLSRCVDKIGHDKCGGRKTLQVFQDPDTGDVNGYCFKCGSYVEDPYGDNPTPVFEVKDQLKDFKDNLKEISKLRPKELETRRIKLSTMKLYKVLVGVSETDGVTPQSVYFPYFSGENKPPSRLKVRILDPKKMWSYSHPDQKDIDLFGFREAVQSGCKRLYITEGEFDAMALYEVMERFTKGDYTIPVPVSLPNGAASAKRDLVRLKKRILQHFNESDVVFVFDNDEAGEKALRDAQTVFPKAVTVVLPGVKDANEGLIKAPKATFAACTFKAEAPKNSRLIAAEDLHEAAKVKAEMGVPWPWPKLTEITRGIRTGETIYIGAGAKIGKSELVNAIAAHLIKEIGWKVLLAKPEEANKKTYKMVAGKLVNKVFHDPNVEFDEKAYDEAGEFIKGNLVLLDLFQHIGWETLERDIRDAANNGVKAAFIDPITNLTNGMEPSAANTKLQEIAQDLSALALQLDIVIFIFCHLRNPDGGPDHSHGGKVLTSQFAGSRAMERSCNYMFGMEGNRSDELSEEERNVRQLVLLSDREFGEVARIPLYWDRKTTAFNQM